MTKDWRMTKMALVKPRWHNALAIWAGADHYPLRHALLAREFSIPVERVSRVYRVEFLSVAGVGLRSRYLVAYRSEKRECLVALDVLPAGLEGWKPTVLNPMQAAQLYLKMVWSEPTAIVSLFLIPAPIFLVMILFLLWMKLVSNSPDLLGLFTTSACDAACVSKVLKVHSMVGALFLMPLGLVVLPIALMMFQGPRYRAAVNFRFAQSYCAVAMVVGVFLLVQLMVFFPFKNYGKFVGAGFGPRAELILKHGMRK